MVQRRYPAFPFAAMAMLMLLGGCAMKPKPHELLVAPAAPSYREEAPETSAEIDELLRMATQDGLVDVALDRLAILQLTSPAPVAAEAHFRRVQLLLQFRYPEALPEALILLNSYPQHALAPNLHLWIAEWGNASGDSELVIEHTQAALKHPRLSKEVARQARTLGLSVIQQSTDEVAVRWWLSLAEADSLNEANWLREAALRASMDIIWRLHGEGLLANETGRGFIEQAARYRLMTGRMEEIRQLASLLAMDAPYSEQYQSVLNWSQGVTVGARIGVMLPLSGRYARYGDEALRGIRLALASLGDTVRASLRIEDTGGQPERAVIAYETLADDGVDMIIGPLLAECVQAVIPQMRPQLPVMSLTSKVELAQDSTVLFTHALPFSAQALFMAHYARQQETTRAAIVYTDQDTSRQEAASFQDMFESIGGEVIGSVELPAGSIDYRDGLRALRAATDNADLLAELWEELEFSEDPDQEMRIPVSFDAMYLALPGKMVSLLAGQLAYMDIMEIALYGSGRWRDGHLLDDRGRYLTGARFSDVSFPEGKSADLRDMLFAYKEAWNDDKPGKLVGLGYDSMLIVTMLTSRMGLKGAELARSLKDPSGFAGLTGFVRFDDAGVGHKQFDIFEIRRGKVEPAT